MASIQTRKRKNGTTAWRVVFRTTPGGAPTTETFENARDAQNFARLVDQIGGKAAREKRDAATWDQAPTYRELFERFCTDSHDLADGTLWDYRTTLERCGAFTRFGDIPIDTINHADIQAWANERVKYVSPLTGRPLSAKSLRNEISIISTVFTYAISLDIISENPARRTKLPKTRRPAIRVLSVEEYATLLQHVRPDFRPLVQFLAATGMRWGEATALQWRDLARVNDEVWQVTVQRAWKRGERSTRILGIAKTSSSHRTISLPATLVKQLGEPGKPSEFIFTAKRGGVLHHSWFLVNVWKPALATSGIVHVKVHDLRHFHASIMLAEGVPMHAVSKRLGHSSITTTVDTYSFLTTDMRMAGLDSVTRIMALGNLNEPVDAITA